MAEEIQKKSNRQQVGLVASDVSFELDGEEGESVVVLDTGMDTVKVLVHVVSTHLH